MSFATTLTDNVNIFINKGEIASSLLVGEVIDTGGSNLPTLLQSELEEKLLWVNGSYKPFGVPQRFLSRLVLGDNDGLEIWERLTRLPTYYQTDDEIELFHRYGSQIADFVRPGTVLIDLGCG